MSSKNSDFDIRGDSTPTTPIQWKFYSYGYGLYDNRYHYPTTKRTILDEQIIEGLKLNHVYR